MCVVCGKAGEQNSTILPVAEAVRTRYIQSGLGLHCGTPSLAALSLSGAGFWELGKGRGWAEEAPGLSTHGSVSFRPFALLLHLTQRRFPMLQCVRRSETNLLDHFNKCRRDVPVCE